MEKRFIIYHLHLEIALHHLVLVLNAKIRDKYVIGHPLQMHIKMNLLNLLLLIKYEYLELLILVGFLLVPPAKYSFLFVDLFFRDSKHQEFIQN